MSTAPVPCVSSWSNTLLTSCNCASPAKQCNRCARDNTTRHQKVFHLPGQGMSEDSVSAMPRLFRSNAQGRSAEEEKEEG